jgi:anti-sigma regulatory factor (Ser/Thr protein kinase)/ActR/RegA family two-component response regulator
MSSVLLIGKETDTVRSIAQALAAGNCHFECASGGASAIRRLRQQAFDVVITDPETTIDEGLALSEEMRDIRPGMKAILLAPSSTPEEIIAALRARVFLCFSAPFDAHEIASFACRAATDSDWRTEIEVLSAQPDWVSLRTNCHILTAERVVNFLGALHSELPEPTRDNVMLAFREILLNAMEHSAAFNRHKVVEVSAVRTERTIVFYVRDPGTGFRRETLAHAAAARAAGAPDAHLDQHTEMGMRPGGFGILLAQGVVDELIYSETGNEILMIKHTA